MRFVVALVAGIILTAAAVPAGRALGFMDRPSGDGLKIHRRPVSLLGGAAAVAAAGVALAVVGPWPPWGLPASVGVALAGGLIDDLRPLPPWARVLVLVAAAALLVLGTDFAAAGLAGGVALVALVLACANAVNIVDGQDGLAGGLAMISALGLVALVALGGAGSGETAVSVGLALAGGLAGFLVWNRPRARVFMGNGGAYAVGTILGFLAAVAVAVEGWRGLLAAGVVLGPFVFELVFTVARRAASGGGAVTAGDRMHSYDLVARTAGRSASTVVFWVLGALTAGLGVLVSVVPLPLGVLVAAVAAALAGLWAYALWSRRPVTT